MRAFLLASTALVTGSAAFAADLPARMPNQGSRCGRCAVFLDGLLCRWPRWGRLGALGFF